MGDITYTPIGATGPGGQHVNRKATGVRAVHKDGTTVVIRGRSLRMSKRLAREEIARRRREAKTELRAEQRKARRDEAIKPSSAVRTYDYKTGIVTDHRTKRQASLKNVLQKGRLELLK